MSGSGKAHFGTKFDVSRETLDRLSAHADILHKWNRRINLVGPADEQEIWMRHFINSAQLWSFMPPGARRWADLGSGGGFPGLVIAALAAEAAPDLEVILVESDVRKAAFLGEAGRAMGLSVRVLPERIENVTPLLADVVSARALAPLSHLLAYFEKHRSPTGIGLFPKGETVHKEIDKAERERLFEYRLHQSMTQPGAAIVEIGAVPSV